MASQAAIISSLPVKPPTPPHFPPVPDIEDSVIP